MISQSPTRPFTSRIDLWIIAALLIAGIALWLLAGKDTGTVCEIYLNNERIRTVSLTEDQVLVLEEVPSVTLEIKDGSIAFVSSDCDDKTCIHTGAISRSGQYAICLPNRLMIQIPSDTHDFEQVDGVTGSVPIPGVKEVML